MSKLIPVQNIATLEDMIHAQEDNLAALLPSDVSLDFMRANIIAACSANPKLLTECTRSSLMQAVFEACELGLMVHSSLSEAWIVQYKNKATFIPGYQGLTKLAYNAGFVRKIESRPVYSNDQFDVEYGLNPVLYLRENYGNRGVKKGVYCLIELTTGGAVFEYWTMDQIEEIHEKSASYQYWKRKGKGGGIWDDPHNRLEMDRKAVWRNVSKWIPRSGTRYARALDIDQREYTGEWDMSDAEERLYAAVGAKVQVKSKPAKEEPKEEPSIDKLLGLLEDHGSADPDAEALELMPLFLSRSPRGSDDVVVVKVGDLDDLEPKQVASVCTILGRLSDSKGYDDARIVKFLRFVAFTKMLISTTRNLDSACTEFVQSEKAVEESIDGD